MMIKISKWDKKRYHKNVVIYERSQMF